MSFLSDKMAEANKEEAQDAIDQLDEAVLASVGRVQEAFAQFSLTWLEAKKEIDELNGFIEDAFDHAYEVFERAAARVSPAAQKEIQDERQASAEERARLESISKPIREAMAMLAVESVFENEERKRIAQYPAQLTPARKLQ